MNEQYCPWLHQRNVVQVHYFAYYVLGRGAITSAEISFLSSPESFMTDPPTFTLRCIVFGGPPEMNINIWALAGAENNLLKSSIYTISDIVVHGTGPDLHLNPRYSSTLTVTGNQPGDYVCRASNKAVPSRVIQALVTIEGNLCQLLGVCTTHTPLNCPIPHPRQLKPVQYIAMLEYRL